MVVAQAAAVDVVTVVAEADAVAAEVVPAVVAEAEEAVANPRKQHALRLH